MHIYIYICTYVYIYIYTYIYVCVYVSIFICIYIYITRWCTKCNNTCRELIYTNTPNDMIPTEEGYTQIWWNHISMHLHIYMCIWYMYVYIYTHTDIYIYIITYTYTCMYTVKKYTPRSDIHKDIHFWHTYSWYIWDRSLLEGGVVCCSVLQRDAAWCSVLQCVAVCCTQLRVVASI